MNYCDKNSHAQNMFSSHHKDFREHVVSCIIERGTEVDKIPSINPL